MKQNIGSTGSILQVQQKWLLVLAFVFACCLPGFAQAGKVTTPVKEMQDTYPVPTLSNQLFYLQRNANTNTVIYEANIKSNGQIDADNPVRVYWIRYAEGGVRKDLSYIQRVFAYGIKTQLQSPDVFNAHVVSYKKAQLTVKRSAKDNKYHAYATINKKEALLHRIYIKVDGGAFWSPNVVYIEMKGKDEATGEEVMERFKPS